MKLILLFELLSIAQELRLGSLAPRRGQTKKEMVMTKWSLRKVAMLLPPCTECPTPDHHLSMNIIIWNSRGALKSNFQSHVHDLVHDHNLAIMVVMETKIGGTRAKEITDRLPFDGAIHTNTIGYVGGALPAMEFR